MNEPTKCSRCTHADAEIGMDCTRCHYTAIIMLTVHRYWPANELEEVRGILRKDRLFELIKGCPVGAKRSLRLFHLIAKLAHASKMDADTLKQRVCDEITRYTGDMKGVAAYEAKHGEGSWMAAWVNAVGNCLQPKGT